MNYFILIFSTEFRFVPTSYHMYVLRARHYNMLVMLCYDVFLIRNKIQIKFNKTDGDGCLLENNFLTQ